MHFLNLCDIYLQTEAGRQYLVPPTREDPYVL